MKKKESFLKAYVNNENIFGFTITAASILPQFIVYRGIDTVGFIDFYHGSFDVEFSDISSDCLYSREFEGRDDVRSRMEGFKDKEQGSKYFAIAIKVLYERLEFEKRTRCSRTIEENWGLFSNMARYSRSIDVKSIVNKIKTETLNMNDEQTRNFLNKEINHQETTSLIKKYSSLMGLNLGYLQFIFGWRGLVDLLGVNALRVYLEDNTHKIVSLQLFPFDEFMNIETEHIYRELLTEQAKDEYPQFEEILFDKSKTTPETLSFLQQMGLF